MIHLRLLEVEAGQIPMHREAGRTRLVADGAYGPVGAFGFKQMLDEPAGGVQSGVAP